MAIMINCATDWTYDLFAEDTKLYKATPMKGIYPNRNASDREKFMVWLKGEVRDFRKNWAEIHTYDYDHIWIGDAFRETLMKGLFSDLYKDTYGQRPHLNIWYYIHLLDLPMSEDVTRTFCATPIEDAIKEAKKSREDFI